MAGIKVRYSSENNGYTKIKGFEVVFQIIKPETNE